MYSHDAATVSSGWLDDDDGLLLLLLMLFPWWMCDCVRKDDAADALSTMGV